MRATRTNYLAAAAKAEAWAATARGAGRTADAELLELLAQAGREAAGWADESETLAKEARAAEPVPRDAPACSLCGHPGTPAGMGWSCTNRVCPRHGVMVARTSFEARPENASGSRLARPDGGTGQDPS